MSEHARATLAYLLHPISIEDFFANYWEKVRPGSHYTPSPSPSSASRALATRLGFTFAFGLLLRNSWNFLIFVCFFIFFSSVRS